MTLRNIFHTANEYMKDHIFELQRNMIDHRSYTQLKQFKYMIFHIFICIIHFLRVYYELTM